MSKLNHVWVKRSDEWIKQNPNKPTMYKALKNESENKQRRTFTKRSKKLSNIKSGVYAIVCESSKSAYIGQSKSISVRLRNHKMNLKNQTNKCESYKRMYEDVNKFGIDSFDFRCIELTDVNLLNKETEAMNMFMNLGYKLYNAQVNSSSSYVYCPFEIQDLIVNIITEYIKDNSTIEKYKI
jgi:group I intron endonuclease